MTLITVCFAVILDSSISILMRMCESQARYNSTAPHKISPSSQSEHRATVTPHLIVPPSFPQPIKVGDISSLLNDTSKSLPFVRCSAAFLFYPKPTTRQDLLTMAISAHDLWLAELLYPKWNPVLLQWLPKCLDESRMYRYCYSIYRDFERWREDVRADAVPTDNKMIIDYEIAGRDAGHDFRDLRSASKAQKRSKKEREKYYNFKGVKRGQLGKDHYTPDGSLWGHRHLLNEDEAEITTMTKRLLYREAQHYPRPPTYHHSNYRRQSHWCNTLRAQKRLRDRRTLIRNLPNDISEGRDCVLQYDMFGLPRMMCFCEGEGWNFCRKDGPWRSDQREKEYKPLEDYSEWWEWHMDEEGWEFKYDPWDIRKQICFHCWDRVRYFPFDGFPENGACKGHDGSDPAYRAMYDALEQYLYFYGEDESSLTAAEDGGSGSFIDTDAAEFGLGDWTLFSHADSDWSELESQIGYSEDEYSFCGCSDGDSASDFEVIEPYGDYRPP